MENKHIFLAKQITTIKTYPEVLGAYNNSHLKYWIGLLLRIVSFVYFILYFAVTILTFSNIIYLL